MMCEVPSNAILAYEFLEYFDGFSIGSNDLTQLSLGLDRDSGDEILAADFKESDLTVKRLITQAIEACFSENKYVGICGQGPSDDPDFAHWLMDKGISSLSLNPDTIIDTWKKTRAIKFIKVLDAKDYQWIFAIQRIGFQGKKRFICRSYQIARAQRFYSSPVPILG